MAANYFQLNQTNKFRAKDRIFLSSAAGRNVMLLWAKLCSSGSSSSAPFNNFMTVPWINIFFSQQGLRSKIHYFRLTSRWRTELITLEWVTVWDQVDKEKVKRQDSL